MPNIPVLQTSDMWRVPTRESTRKAAAAARRIISKAPLGIRPAAITVKPPPKRPGRFELLVFTANDLADYYHDGKCTEAAGAILAEPDPESVRTTKEIIGLVDRQLNLLWPHVRELQYHDGRWITSTVNGWTWFDWLDVLRVAEDLEPEPVYKRDYPGHNGIDRRLYDAMKAGTVKPAEEPPRGTRG